MTDPSKDLWEAASQTMMPPSQSRQLAEQPRVRSAGLSRRRCELRRWRDGQNQSVSPLAVAARQRSELLAGVSRELPTPLNSMLILATPLSRLEMTIPRLEDGLAGASHDELGGIAAELIEQVCELRAAADALTRAHQADDDLSVGVLPPDACAR